jgi:hypothetical protein
VLRNGRQEGDGWGLSEETWVRFCFLVEGLDNTCMKAPFHIEFHHVVKRSSQLEKEILAFYFFFLE